MQEYDNKTVSLADEDFKYFTFDYQNDENRAVNWSPGKCYGTDLLGPAYGFSVTHYTKGRSYVTGGIDSGRLFWPNVFLISAESGYRHAQSSFLIHALIHTFAHSFVRSFSYSLTALNVRNNGFETEKLFKQDLYCHEDG